MLFLVFFLSYICTVPVLCHIKHKPKFEIKRSEYVQ